MAESFRLATGGRIDRTRPLTFTFNGRTMRGSLGDTLASALLANGVRLAGRSFKYHRPRGIISSGIEEPGVFVERLGADASANEPATMIPLVDGLAARSVKGWPSPAFDLGGINQILRPILPAGFYYKTLIWPSWMTFEPFIRQAAGLAHAPRTPPPPGTRFETRHHHCDILVAGAGPAGLMAALTAARCGLRVMIADMNPEPGGRLLDRRLEVDGKPGPEWAADTAAAFAGMTNVVHLQNALVWAVREHNLFMVREQHSDTDGPLERNWAVRTRQGVIATGAIERMLVFPDNDRPGVMLASAVQAYINRYAVGPGRRAVVVTNNDGTADVAHDMLRAGIDIAAIVDTRANTAERWRSRFPDVRVLDAAELSGIVGRTRVRAIRAITRSGRNRAVTVSCDFVAVSGGWNPSVQLWSQARLPLRFDHPAATFLPSGRSGSLLCAGSAAGRCDLASAIADGAAAGAEAAARLGYEARPDLPAASDSAPFRIEAWWHPDAAGGSGRAFVDIMNDVTLADIRLAVREGYRAIEHVKRYTTAGMGLDQGRTGNVNVVAAVATETGQDIGDVGVTTFRAPVAPVSFGAIQGDRKGSAVLPYRHTPLTRWTIEQGAVMYEAGARWRRPGYFPRSGETMVQAVDREARAVRTGVGVYDGSPLGTFAIKGPDAGRLLDMVYTNRFSGLGEGAGRYGLMLTDDGRILDDGVSFRTGPHAFLMSTSTANAETVCRHIRKFLAFDRPEWSVRITDITCQHMNATVCGPRAREVVAALETDIDLSRDAFPFMTFRDGTVAGHPARVARVSFTGELSFEINVRPRNLRSLWDRILEAGAPFGITPIGSETNHVLRVEKGFLSTAHEVDGTTDPIDLGMAWILPAAKGDFIGKRSVFLRRASGRPRRELVGLHTEDPERVLPEGAPITENGRRQASVGFVTASVWSGTCGRSIALALIENGRARKGSDAHVRIGGEIVRARIVEPCFYDPSGTALRG
ncbi:MAG: 2Fe-2S iron-sulfur cluster-binding protein [Paracoccaceae bacterium]|nr:2Fe-2S iron-sulfur cluster-binding protein [Paracoccaceae bacterium]